MVLDTKLGPYQVLEQVGKGGMAAVYRARQPSVERDVAIKVILNGIASDPAAAQRFQREARLVARLEHPHILPVYDFDGSNDPPYIVMRYLDGGTLKDLMTQGLLPHDEVDYLVRQVCSALDYAHRQGITHRDIKPSNILIDREGNAFVTDFGIARITASEGKKGITETGMIIGTPDYMSPEQARGDDDIDYRTDIYALGVMLFEILTGELPFQSTSSLQVLVQHMNAPIPSVLARQAQLPGDIETVIAQAMAKDRNFRYASAADMSAAVTAALGGTRSTNPSRLREAAETHIIRRMGKADQTERPVTPSEQNKTVVVLNASAAEYGEWVATSNGTEAARRALQVFWGVARQIIGEYGGIVFTQTDQELLALWGVESAREDDAEQAVRVGLRLQMALREHGAAFIGEQDTLPLNIGIHRGLALITPGEKNSTYSASGATISLTNRLMQTAEGAILITHEVFRQVVGVFDMQPGEPLKVRGRAEKINTYQVDAAKARSFRLIQGGVDGVETPLIGRDAELRHLQKAFLVAVEDGEMQVVTLVSDAGVGKSRLLYEFDKWSELRPEEYFIFSGRATPAMTPRPYALIRDVIAFRFEVLDDDVPAVALDKIERGVAEMIGPDAELAHFIAYLVGIDVSSSPYLKGILSDAQETNRRARQSFIRLLTTLAKAEPTVLELEDIHHADDASLDLLNDLSIADENLQLLIINCARPALYERRPTWGSGQNFHTRLELKPLDKRDSRDLALAVLQKVKDVPKDLRDLLVDRAEGNPLYMEELVKMLLDDRVILRESEDSWRIEVERLDVLTVPSTLSGLLETRLDTLLYPEKLTLQRASVIGRIFYDTALTVIDDVDETHIRELPALLAKLVERDFIQLRETSAFADSKEYIFASTMLRDTLYDRLLERQLQVYHTGAATWLAGLERSDDYLPLIAEHYEKAGEVSQATFYWRRAGEALLKRGSAQAALQFLQRAQATLPASTNPTARLELLLALGDAANALGDVNMARTTLHEALALARADHNPTLLVNTLYQLSYMEDNYGDYPAAQAYLDEALPLAQAGTDQTLLGHVLSALSNINFRRANYAEAETLARECAALAKTIGDDVLLINALNRIANAFDYTIDFARIPQAEGYLHEALELAQRIGHRERQQSIMGNLGLYASLREDWPTAISYVETSLVLARELGVLINVCLGAMNLAEISIAAGRLEKVPLYLLEGLVNAKKSAAMAWITGSIDTIARWKIFQGQTNEGLKLFGLAHYHPASSADGGQDRLFWLKNNRDLIPVSDAEIEALMEAGRDMDVDTVTEELLVELTAYTNSLPSE